MYLQTPSFGRKVTVKETKIERFQFSCIHDEDFKNTAPHSICETSFKNPGVMKICYDLKHSKNFLKKDKKNIIILWQGTKRTIYFEYIFWKMLIKMWYFIVCVIILCILIYHNGFKSNGNKFVVSLFPNLIVPSSPYGSTFY